MCHLPHKVHLIKGMEINLGGGAGLKYTPSSNSTCTPGDTSTPSFSAKRTQQPQTPSTSHNRLEGHRVLPSLLEAQEGVSIKSVGLHSMVAHLLSTTSSCGHTGTSLVAQATILYRSLLPDLPLQTPLAHLAPTPAASAQYYSREDTSYPLGMVHG